MSEIYRFRTAKQILGQNQELEKQTVYFASPEELNDPMERYREFVWQGDSIIWTNLFKHYINCVSSAWQLFNSHPAPYPLEPMTVPWMASTQQSMPNATANQLNEICDEVFALGKLSEFSSMLANSGRIVSQFELHIYLEFLHFNMGTTLFEVFGNTEIVRRPPDSKPTYLHDIFNFEQIADVVQNTVEKEMTIDIDQNFGQNVAKRVIHKLSQSMNEQSLQFKLRFEQMSPGAQFLNSDFAKSYVLHLGQLAYPDWYAACFSRDYQNSSMWGHYADHHKGICLIFETRKQDDKEVLELDSDDDTQFSASFFPVVYRSKLKDVNFFQSLGRLSVEDLEREWYSDSADNYSACYIGVGTEDWHSNYWDNFYSDITTKSCDWKYEKESRLIRNNMMKEPNRTCRYNFDVLKGIIFGIATPESVKFKIRDIIAEKCKEHQRDKFSFFQTFYDSEEGKFNRYEIDLQLADRD